MTIDPPCASSPIEFGLIQRNKKDIAAAKAICATCPWTEECLAVAKPNWGVYGGLSVAERRSDKTGPEAGAKPIEHGTLTGYGKCLKRPEGSCAMCKDINARKGRLRPLRGRDFTHQTA